MQMLRTAMLAAATSILMAGGPSAWATPLVFTDTVALSTCLSVDAPAPCNEGSASLATTSFTHDILDTGFLVTDVITGAQLELTLSDDGGRRDGDEKLSLTLDLVNVPYSSDANHDATIVLTDLSALSDGTLAAVLGALQGDFFVGGSTLTVWVERQDAPPGGSGDNEPPVPTATVPGPSSLLALGVGLLLVGGVVRRTRGALRG